MFGAALITHTFSVQQRGERTFPTPRCTASPSDVPGPLLKKGVPQTLTQQAHQQELYPNGK